MVLVALVAAALVRGDPGPLIDWHAPANCPGVAFVEDAVGRLIGRAVLPSDAAEARVTARVEVREDGLLRLDLQLQSRAGERHREMLGHTCTALADAVALELAAALDPLAVVKELEQAEVLPADRSRGRPTGSTVSASPVPTESAEAGEPSRPGEVTDPSGPAGPAEPSSAIAPARHKFRAGVRASGAVAFGVFGPVTPLAELVGAVIGKGFRVETGGRYWFERRIAHENEPSAGVDLALAAAVVRGCPVPRLGRVEFPTCVGVEAGAVRAQGAGVSQARTRWRAWVALTASAALAVPVAHRVALWFEAGVGVPMNRPAFAVQNLGLVYRVPAATGWSGLGLEIRLP